MSPKTWKVIKAENQYTDVQCNLTKKEAKALAIALNIKAGRVPPASYLYLITKQ